MFFDDVKEFFKIAFFVLSIGIFILFIFAAFLAFGAPWAKYRLDQSYCTAKVNNEVVYNGRCFYLDLKSIGENGNTKELTIYKDRWLTQPSKHFVNNDITIQEYNKGGING